VNIILGQLGDLLGSPQKGRPALVKAFNVLSHPSEMSLTAAAVGVSALVLMAVLSRTRISSVASLVALGIPTLVTLGAGDLIRVNDSGKIPSGFPTPHIPQLSLLSSLDLIAGAAAVAVIVLVQGTGVAEAAPNPGGSASDPNRDFIAQGVGNIASGLFRGQPVGGSVGQTALNVAAGARGRWASIFSGVWMLLILVLFSRVVGKIPIPTLAAVLIFAAASSLRVGRIDTIMRTGLPSQLAFFATFVATILLPVTAAVGVGVALSLLLQINQEAIDLTVVRLTRADDRTLVETPAPARLPSHEVTLLDVYGSLLLAGARTLQTRLPDPAGSEQPIVVLRLRGRTTLGATAFIVLADYAERLRAAGGHLFLSGVQPDLHQQLQDTHRVDLQDAVTVIPASDTILESTQKALDEAEAWLGAHAPSS
jgi:SulP family sulfate permease